MSTGTDQYVHYVAEQLEPLRNITTTRFFGGTGIMASGTQFAMIMGGTLYFVVNDTTRQNYELMGSRCFSYSTQKKRVDVKKYYSVPADILEDQDRLIALARESINAASSMNKRPGSRAMPASKPTAPRKQR